MDMLNIVGHKFGSLVVLEWVRRDPYGNQYWKCRCTCGKIVEFVGTSLKNGKVTCCKECRKSKEGYQYLIGQKFGLITVVEILGVAKDFGLSGRGHIVKGLCACGTSWSGPATSLKKGNTKSCGCIKTGPVPNPDRGQPAINSVLNEYKHHATRRGLSWEIPNQVFRDLIKGSCYYCGCAPTSVSCHGRTRGSGKRRKTISEVTRNGIDRKDNSLGYTPSNSVSCCSTCNYSKRGLTHGEFLEKVRLIYLKHFGEPYV